MNYVVDIFCPIFESASENIIKCDPYQLSRRYVKMRPLQLGNFVNDSLQEQFVEKIQEQENGHKDFFLYGRAG